MYKSYKKMKGQDGEVSEMIEYLRGREREKWLTATKWFREYSSLDVGGKDGYIDHIVEVGVIPNMVKFLYMDKNKPLQIEAAKVLINITSGNRRQVKSVLGAGPIPVLIIVLTSYHEELQELSAGILINITNFGPQYRDLVLNFRVMTPLLRLLQRSKRLDTIKNGARLLSNLYRGVTPPPDFDKISPSFPALQKLLFLSDCDVIVDACSALSYYCDGFKNKIEMLFDVAIYRRLAYLLTHENEAVVMAVVQVLKTVITKDETQKKMIIICSVFPNLVQSFLAANVEILEEISEIVENFTAGNQDEIQVVINAGLISVLIDYLTFDNYKVKKYSAKSLLNIACVGNEEQVGYLVEQGFIPQMNNIFAGKDSALVLQGLKSIERIVHQGDDYVKKHGGNNPYVEMIKEFNVLDQIDDLKNSENEVIFQTAWLISKKCHGVNVNKILEMEINEQHEQIVGDDDDDEFLENWEIETPRPK